MGLGLSGKGLEKHFPPRVKIRSSPNHRLRELIFILYFSWTLLGLFEHEPVEVEPHHIHLLPPCP